MVGSDLDFIALLNTTAEAGTVVQQAIEVFRQYPHLFRNFYTFPGTIEFVSLEHIPTGFSIDVIFNDLDGVVNTALITYLINLDKRVFDLVMVIRYWAKVHELTRERVLSNYAMTMMVIFYLQQRGVLPSIASLQWNAKPHLVEDWNKEFEELQYEPHINISFYHLLGGFFEYYNEIDFGKNIISAFSGSLIERKLFSDLRTVPVVFDLYKRNVRLGVSRALILKSTPVIIQDPFTHFENLAKHLKSESLAKFIARIKSAALFYRENNEGRFLDDILSVRWN